MKRKTRMILFTGILLFVLLIVLAIKNESSFLLYAASILPFLLVPFLPDIPSGQWLKPSGKKGNVTIYRTEASAETHDGLIVIDFTPGTIHWNKRKLFFSINSVPSTVYTVPETPGIATLSVLPYDLFIHPRKKNCYGIELKHLLERAASFSFTTEEVGRLIIRMADLQQLHSSQTVTKTGTMGKGLGA